MRFRAALPAACAAFALASSASAGGIVSRGGTHPHLDIETAWLVWEPSTGRQELLVAAQFGPSVEPFAWALPLPSPAEVTAVDADLRLALSTILRAYQRRAPAWVMPAQRPAGPLSDIVFGDQGKVNWEQVSATEPDALPRLLGAPLSRRNPTLDLWLERYASRHATIVGLRLDPSNDRQIMPYVRLRFSAERPWYPFREPPWKGDDHEGSKGRVLRINVLAPEQVAWRAGPAMPTLAPAWLSFEVAHDELKKAFGEPLHKVLFDPASRYWLTSFEDWHETRPGDDDVTFALHAPLPADGAPGTLGDTSGKGIALEPVGPLQQEKKKEPSAEAASDEPAAHAPPGRSWSRRARTAAAFGAMLLLALAGWAVVRAQR